MALSKAQLDALPRRAWFAHRFRAKEETSSIPHEGAIQNRSADTLREAMRDQVRQWIMERDMEAEPDEEFLDDEEFSAELSEPRLSGHQIGEMLLEEIAPEDDAPGAPTPTTEASTPAQPAPETTPAEGDGTVSP